MLRREVDNLKRNKLREQRERNETGKRIEALEKDKVRESNKEEERKENERLKSKIRKVEEENALLKEKIKKYESKEDRAVKTEVKKKKEADNMEKIAERYIDKEKTLLLRKGKAQKEKIETWIRRHAGEVEYKIVKLWTTDAVRWLIFKEKVDRDSLYMKERKVNEEDVLTIEEVKEGRERWGMRKVTSQINRLDMIRRAENSENKREELEGGKVEEKVKNEKRVDKRLDQRMEKLEQNTERTEKKEKKKEELASEEEPKREDEEIDN